METFAAPELFVAAQFAGILNKADDYDNGRSHQTGEEHHFEAVDCEYGYRVHTHDCSGYPGVCTQENRPLALAGLPSASALPVLMR